MKYFIVVLAFLLSCSTVPDKAKLPEPTEMQKRSAFMRDIVNHTAIFRLYQCAYNPGSCDILEIDGSIYLYSDFITESRWLPQKYLVNGKVIYLDYRCPKIDRLPNPVCEGG